MKNLTTVIITCHNYGKFLSQCIDSVLDQTVELKEIIVINDSSSDNSDEVAKKYNDKIRYFKVNFKNVQETRNFGLKKVSSKYLLFLDADDFLRKDCIEKMQKVMEDDKHISLVYSDRYHVNYYNCLKKDLFKREWHSIEFDYKLLRRFNYISLASLIKKDSFLGFDESIKRFQDWDAWLTFLKNKKALRIKDDLSFRRFHGSNLTFNESDSERAKVLLKHGFNDVIIEDYRKYNEGINNKVNFLIYKIKSFLKK